MTKTVGYSRGKAGSRRRTARPGTKRTNIENKYSQSPCMHSPHAHYPRSVLLLCCASRGMHVEGWRGSCSPPCTPEVAPRPVAAGLYGHVECDVPLGDSSNDPHRVLKENAFINANRNVREYRTSGYQRQLHSCTLLSIPWITPCHATHHPSGSRSVCALFTHRHEGMDCSSLTPPHPTHQHLSTHRPCRRL